MGCESDYTGDMSYYQNQLLKKGITKSMFNMDNYAGLTAHELQALVNSIELKKSHAHQNNKYKERWLKKCAA